ncbi:hypothetical protein [Bradyrhizobium sp. AZCC 1693]|uniref:hypothetical protein n=1 Tax=Bradyrhizobium sp. AZCC 1693 TaxID=3117029 RepID=UPI002FF27442
MADLEEFAIVGAMTAKDNEELIARVPQWPKERLDASRDRLTDAQAQEVARIQRDIREGRAALATDEQMAALWKSCGL